VKFVFFNVVGKKNSFWVFRYFRCFAIKNPPRAAWAFSSFSFVSVPCGRPENIFRIFRDFRCFHDQESAPRSWGNFRVFLSQSDCKRTKKKKSFVSFVKFVFFNVVGKKIVFAFFRFFRTFSESQPAPRSWGNFRLFRQFSIHVAVKNKFFAFSAIFDVSAIKNPPRAAGASPPFCDLPPAGLSTIC